MVTSWRAKVIVDIDDKCQTCMADIPQTITHRFWDYRMAHKAWDFSIRIIDIMKARPGQRGHKNHWNGSMGFLVRKFLPHLVNILEFGFYLEPSHCGLFG